MSKMVTMIFNMTMNGRSMVGTAKDAHRHNDADYDHDNIGNGGDYGVNRRANSRENRTLEKNQRRSYKMNANGTGHRCAPLCRAR